MRRRQPWLLAASLCILIPAAGRAQQAKPAPDSNVVLARHLLETTHQGDNLVAGIEAAMSEQRRQNTQLPAVFYDSLLARLKRTVPEVLDSLAPLYARRFKRSELEAIIHFFESPAGPPSRSLLSPPAASSAQSSRRSFTSLSRPRARPTPRNRRASASRRYNWGSAGALAWQRM